METKIVCATLCLLIQFVTSISLAGVAIAQKRGRVASPPVARESLRARTNLTGVYRLDPLGSDKLYSLISEADTNLPYAKQQRFFDDLTVRLTSPDQLAIEQRGREISIASSRAPRITFDADGRVRTERGENGQTTRTRAALETGRLIVSSEGDGTDDFNIVFETFDDGRRLRVTRHITANNLNQPLIVRSIYEKIANVARWNIYQEPSSTQTASNGMIDEPINTVPNTTVNTARATERSMSSTTAEDNQANALRAQLEEWLAATNAGDIERQLDFYLPRVAAYYLARNVSREQVRTEKSRVFKRASRIAITAGAPEIILRDASRTAIMRFRKQYDVEVANQSRRGAVIQELRWQRTPAGWKIFSERDVRVIR